MKTSNSIQNKILTLAEAKRRIAQWRVLDNKVVFTNGCFDILHAGHIFSFLEASKEGEFLIVGLNADASVKQLKGKNRPVNDEHSRALLVAALAMVDAVVIFSEPTPLELIKVLQPDVLVKGGDYKVEEIAGAKEVIAWGGKVVINPILNGFSTTDIINKLQNK